MSEGSFDKQRPPHSAAIALNLESRVSEPRKYRSQGERKIARLLAQYGIPFTYEKPLAVRDEGKTKIWYPDFYLFCGVYIEYFGINGEQSYRDRTKHKLRVYAENCINVIPVYPQDLEGRWQRRLLGRIDKTLEKIINAYRIRAGAELGEDSDDLHRHYLKLR